MKQVRIVKIIAVLMSLHFGGVTIYTYNNDSIVIETESDSDSESEDSNKEQKLFSLHTGHSEISIVERKPDSFFAQSKWNVPHIEISSPPPDLT